MSMTLQDPMKCSTPGFPVLHYLPEFAQTQCPLNPVIPSNHLIFCCPLLLPSHFPCIRVFSFHSTLCIRWPKYRSFSTSPCSEYSGLISFRMKLVSSPCCPREVSRAFSSTVIRKHQFFGTQPSLWSNSHIRT